MARKEIFVTIGEQGEVDVEAAGFTGGKCIKETTALIEALGGDPSDYTKKPEFDACKLGQKAKKRVKA